MGDDRVVPIDQGSQAVVTPDQPALIACCGLLEHEADPLLVGLALQAWEPASRAAEAHSTGFAHADAIGGLIGATRQGLGGIGIQVLSDPGRIRLCGEGMRCVFRKAELLAQRRKSGFACLLLGTRDEVSLLPSYIGTHPAQALHGLTQQRIVQVASGLKMPTQMPGLLAVHL